MRDFVLLLFLLIPAMLMAKSHKLVSFDQVMDALKGVSIVKTVFYYKNYQLISDTEIEDKSVDPIGGMKI